MATVVAKVGVKKVKGYLYFVDKRGNVARAQMARGGKKGGKVEVVAKAGIKKKPGFLYFIDKQGHIAAAAMARGGRKRKKRR